ncbi:hypothetical protein OBB02_02850 [Candidatus Puniceispirillum sp.]|nr:hypothetical protein [Candidatus Puniceispirillum sp.]
MKQLYTLVTLAAALWLPINAGAETAENSPQPELVIGSIMPGDVGTSASGTAYGFTVNAALDYEFKNGLFAGIAYPSHTEEGSATELLVGYGSLSYDKIKGTLTVTDGSNSASISGSAAVKGDIKALAAIYSWKTSHDGLYFGGGLGAAFVNDKINSIGGDANISGKESGVVPVGAVQAGYRMAGSGDKPVNLDVSYRYLYFLSGQNGLSDLAANSVFINLSIPF